MGSDKDGVLDIHKNSLCVSIVFKDEQTLQVEHISENIYDLSGYKNDEILKLDKLIYKDDFQTFYDELNQKKPTITHTNFRVLTKDDDIVWVMAKSVKDEQGTTLYLVDINEMYEQNLELSNALSVSRSLAKRFKSYFDALDASYILTASDLDGNITYANEKAVAITGFSESELIGKPHNIIRHPDTPKETFKDMWQTIQSKKIWQGMIKNQAKDGSDYYVQATISPILDEHENIVEYVAIRYDQSEFIAQQQHIQAMAFTSAMTSLPNLYALMKDIYSRQDLFLAIVNIDEFKVINNNYGYSFGDEVIKKLSKRLQEQLCSEHIGVYHIHADEFGVLCSSGNYDMFQQKLQSFQAGILGSECELSGYSVPVQISIATSDEPTDRLLSTANMAMSFARINKLKFVSYTKDIDFTKKYDDNIRWISMLRKAIKEGGIVPFFQPIYNLRTGKIEKYESLIRVVENGEVYSPFFFLDIAKKAKLYPELSAIMLEKTFEKIFSEPYDFSINISIDDIKNQETTDLLFDLLQKPRVGGVVLEIVESEGIENFEEIDEFMQKVRDFGCKIAIDDFGSGYSNFEYIIKLNPDFLKIDGSLIKHIDIDQGSNDIVSTIVTFAKKRGIELIAEFISNERIFDTVSAMDIDYAQGFFISQPKATLTKKPLMIRCIN
ncbi:MAG: EAL domain-containing protein [Sulfurimonadaceae bacterium]|jgi:PAS domain S-box-containing protein/diguanylate cyclase (GGDEF)-like protein|nr:EAL domain-containing protein [Sulfurimonadaceae bacterium]